MKIKAALARKINHLTVEEVELSPPKATEVLIQMKAAGVCHSDLHTYRGELRATASSRSRRSRNRNSSRSQRQ